MKQLVLLFVRLAVRLYYSHTEVSGAPRVPRHGPVLIAANHFNSLADALMLMAALPRRPVFGAAVFLFKKPIVGALLKWMGCVPIHRAIDEGADPRDNQASLGALGDALKRGGVVGLFPEGISRLEPRLQKIKVGTARLAFLAEEQSGWKLGLTVLPVGLQYEDSPRWRSAVRVQIQEPLRVADWREKYAEHPRRAMGDFTKVLESRLRAASLHAEDWHSRGAALFASRCYLAELKQGTVRHRFEDDLIQGAHRAGTQTATVLLEWRERTRIARPEELADLERRARRLQRLLQSLNLEVEELDKAGRPLSFILRSTLRWLLWIVLLPVAVWGRVNSWLCENLLEWIERRYNPDGIAATTTWRLFPGLVVVPVIHFIQAIILAVLLFVVSPLAPAGIVFIALIYLLTLLPSWFVSLRMRDLRHEQVRLLRSLQISLTGARHILFARRERRSLARDMERLALEMLASDQGVSLKP